MQDKSRRVSTALRVLALLLLLPSGLVSRQEPLSSTDLATLWRSVDAVVYLRIQETLPAETRQVGGKTGAIGTEHKASILEVFRRSPGALDASTVRFLQISANTANFQVTNTGHEAPYRPGEALVAFFRWNKSEEEFQGHIVVPVRDGQVKSPHIHEIESGMKLEAFLVKLRAMME